MPHRAGCPTEQGAPQGRVPHRAGCPTGQGAPTEHLAQRTRRVEMEVPGSAGGEPTMPAEVGGRKTEIGT